MQPGGGLVRTGKCTGHHLNLVHVAFRGDGEAIKLWSGSRAAGRDAANDHCEMRVIFDPSRVKLYIRPSGSRMNPMTGLVILLVSIEPPAPKVMIAIEPSIPTFQPAVRLNCSRAPGVMNMMMTDLTWAPSWKPNEADTVL